MWDGFVEKLMGPVSVIVLSKILSITIRRLPSSASKKPKNRIFNVLTIRDECIFNQPIDTLDLTHKIAFSIFIICFSF